MFQNSETIQILSLPENPRPYLILIRAGSNPRPCFFNEPAPDARNYDIGLNYYSSPHPDDAFRTTAELVFGGGLSKLHGAKRLFEATGLHEVYNGVFFLDDDVELLFVPDEFFALCREYALDLAQPALTLDSSDAIGITLQHPSLILRTTNWVEIMAPFLARDFLREMLHSFDFSISGWGIDIYWGHHLGDRWKAGIVDHFLIRHTNTRDFVNGAFYKYLRSLNINPFVEMDAILTKIGHDSYLARSVHLVSRTYLFGPVR